MCETVPMTHLAKKHAQSVSVFLSDALHVTNGANLGDALSFADDLILDDIYGLRDTARLIRLSVYVEDAGHFTIAPDTALGKPGTTLHMDCGVTLMSPDGATTEVLVMVAVDDHGSATDIFALPLAPLMPKLDYTLVGIDTKNARTKFAEVACVSFTRGTHIALASGQQVPIESLKVGDRVLTRDDGPQQIRWIGQNTVRAMGEFAPIVITAHTLHNENDLVVSPDHRLFIYQRSDALGAGRSELLVKARHLVNGDSVYRRDGGFVDYFQLLFDHHQIIYAEGIAAETLLVDTRTRAALPRDLAEKLSQSLPGKPQSRPDLDIEVQESMLDRPDAAALLRRASTR